MNDFPLNNLWVTLYLTYLRPIKDTFTTSWSQLSISTQTSAPWTTSSTGPWHTEETRTSTVPTAELLRSNLILREQNWRHILKHLGKRINTWRGEKKNMLLGLSATARHRFIVCYIFFLYQFYLFSYYHPDYLLKYFYSISSRVKCIPQPANETYHFWACVIFYQN